MHRRYRSIVFLLVALVLAAAPLPSHARASQSLGKPNTVTKHSVLASYSVGDAAGCVTTSVFVSADTRTGAAPMDSDAAPPGAQVALTRVDACAKRTLLAASGAVAFDGGELEVKGNPRSARLRVVVPTTDAATGATFDARVDLAWRGVDSVERGTGASAPPQANAPRVRTRYREATLSGSVSDGTTDFAPGPAAVASITTALFRLNGTSPRAREAAPSFLGIGGVGSTGPDGTGHSALSGSLVGPPCQSDASVGRKP